jgi:hypothetical protein
MLASCQCRLRADAGFVPMLVSRQCRLRADVGFEPFIKQKGL